jgi:hypothetical protein
MARQPPASPVHASASLTAPPQRAASIDSARTTNRASGMVGGSGGGTATRTVRTTAATTVTVCASGCMTACVVEHAESRSRGGSVEWGPHSTTAPVQSCQQHCALHLTCLSWSTAGSARWPAWLLRNATPHRDVGATVLHPSGVPRPLVVSIIGQEAGHSCQSHGGAHCFPLAR